jgi:transcriptional regulator with XRE-family HTH domain
MNLMTGVVYTAQNTLILIVNQEYKISIDAVFWQVVLCYDAAMPTEIVTSREIGKIIREQRKALGLSQEQLSEKVGVSYQQIQRYENGGSMLNVENMQRVANALSIPIAQFFEGGTLQQNPIEPAASIVNSDEKTLLKHFRQISENPDRQAVMLVARRLAAKQKG